MSSSPMHVLVVEDNEAHAEAIRRALETASYAVEVRVTGTLEGYGAELTASTPDLVLMDLNLPDGRAVDCLQSPPEAGSFPILVMTSYGNEQTVVESLKSGALDYVVKSPEAFAAMPRILARARREWQHLQKRKQDEEALRLNEERYQALIRTTMEGYWLVDGEGRLLEVNDTYCAMIGYSREMLLTMGVGDLACADTKAEVRAHVAKVKACGADRFETRHCRAGGKPVEVEVNTVYLKDRREFASFIHDISERKRSEKGREATLALLRLCNRTSGLRELMPDLLDFFGELTGCEAVGVRLREGNGFPYYRTRGSAAAFVPAGSFPCTGGEAPREADRPSADCLCGEVLAGRVDFANPFFTPRGSFWLNNASEFRAAAGEGGGKGRNLCLGSGYESVALVPFHLHGESQGLFQFGDPQAGRFTLEQIALVEDLLAYVAITLGKLKTDEALHASDERFRLAMEATSDGLWEWDVASRSTYFSPACYRMLGYGPDSFASSYEAWVDLVHPDDRRQVQEANRNCLENRRDSTYVEFRIRAEDGGWRWILGRGKAVKRNPDGKALLVVGTHVDITELKEGKERIEHLNRVLRAVRSVDQLIAMEKDKGRLIREICQLLVEHRGYKSTLIILADPAGIHYDHASSGKSEAFGKMDDSLNRGVVPSCCRSAGLQAGVFRVIDRDTLCSACIMCHECASSDGMCVELRHGGKGYGFMSVSLTKGQLIDAEEEELFSGLAGDVAFAVHNIDQGLVMRRLQEEHDRIEAQLRQSQKMEAIGQLAGGIAHDFNNMLSVILGYTHVGMSLLEPEASLYNYLQQIDKAAQRSADLTRQLLAFSRKQVVEPRIVNLNEVIADQKKMLGRLIGEDIEVRFAPQEGLWNVLIDPSQLNQILTNLAVNARDAIAGVGSVTIATCNETLGEISGNNLNLPPGDHVLLTFGDSGCGMDPETAERIFEPFFTTKAEGKGTGLGLSTVYGIVKQNNGAIHVLSEPGAGASFAIRLPRNGAETAKPREVPGPQPLDGGETVLIVEDEEQILKLAVNVLKRYGYTVLAASSPEEACRICGEYAAEIHLLLTDVVMPAMNGKELQSRILGLQPGIRTLFMSGYPADIVANRGVIDEGVDFIHKPFMVDALLRKIRTVLAAPPS